MSRIGNTPVEIPSGVSVEVRNPVVVVKGRHGELSHTLSRGIEAQSSDGRITLTRTDDEKKTRGFHGLNRSLVANMVQGVSEGFSRELEIQGIGFRAAIQGQKLTLLLGYSSPIEMEVPAGVTVEVNDNTMLVVKGADKQKVGEVAARIRSAYPPEPYKGKGLRYKGEYVRRKAGKTVA